MRLLCMFTGGTIGSRLFGDGYIGTTKDAPYLLLERYAKQHGDAGFAEFAEPYCMLSENNTAKTVETLIQAIRAQMQVGYDGIVVTHGTDTLQYSAAAIAYTFGKNSIPIVLVSANKPVEDAMSNGIDNLHAALRFLREEQPHGTWVAYRNPNELPKIHRATRLLEHPACSERLESMQNQYYGSYTDTDEFQKNAKYREQADAQNVLSGTFTQEALDGVLWMQPQPFLQYPKPDERVRAVLLSCYHSGTVNTQDACIRQWYCDAQNRQIPVLLCGITKTDAYESTKAYAKLGITPLYDIAPIAAYVKLLMLISDHRDVRTQMRAPLAGDQ